jgi:hypothetical protein
MNTKNITESSNPVLAGSLPALKRSAARARQIAAQTGTRLVVVPPDQPAKAGQPAQKKR